MEYPSNEGPMTPMSWPASALPSGTRCLTADPSVQDEVMKRSPWRWLVALPPAGSALALVIDGLANLPAAGGIMLCQAPPTRPRRP